MDEMKLWNGSEFQLLRFLGRHRQELDEEILRNININPDLDYKMEWKDFKYNKTIDAEHKGISFMYPEISDSLNKKWKEYWPQKGQQNWDAIIKCNPITPNSKKPDKWVIVEAKAHWGEIKKTSKATSNISIKMIEKAFKETRERFGIKTQNKWSDKYYQLANRLAFVNFMLSNNIEVSLLNIYFINGWPDDPSKNVSSREAWKEKIKDEYDYLGINENAKKHISEIFVNCKGEESPGVLHITGL